MRFVRWLLPWLFEIVTITAAVVAILATLFDWFQLSENVYRNITLGLAALLLATIIRVSIELRLQRDASKTLNDELSQWRSAVKLIGAEVDSSDISKRLHAALAKANRWAFSGGTGSWQRASVLPTLSKITGKDVTYQMQVVNILDGRLREAYAHYRKTCRQTTGIDGRSLALEILSSVLAVCWYGAFTRIEPVVCLSTDYSPLRYDMSESECFITAANKNDPGLAFGSDSWIFSHLVDEFAQDSKTLPQLDLSNAFAALRSRGDALPLGTDEIRTLLDRVDVVYTNSREKLVSPFQLSDVELDELWKRCGVSTQ
jgi:hypothetical protein